MAIRADQGRFDREPSGPCRLFAGTFLIMIIAMTGGSARSA